MKFRRHDSPLRHLPFSSRLMNTILLCLSPNNAAHPTTPPSSPPEFSMTVHSSPSQAWPRNRGRLSHDTPSSLVDLRNCPIQRPCCNSPFPLLSLLRCGHRSLSLPLTDRLLPHNHLNSTHFVSTLRLPSSPQIIGKHAQPTTRQTERGKIKHCY